jgi:prolyl oligopeptidase
VSSDSPGAPARLVSCPPVWRHREHVSAAVVSAGREGPAPLPQHAGGVLLDVIRLSGQRIAVVRVRDAQGTRVLLDPSRTDASAQHHVVAAALSPDGALAAVLVAGADDVAYLSLLQVSTSAVLAAAPIPTRFRALAWDDDAAHVWWVASTDPAAGAQLMSSSTHDHHVLAFLPGPIAVAGLLARPSGGVAATTRNRSGPTDVTRVTRPQRGATPVTRRLSERPARLHRDRDRLLALVATEAQPTVFDVSDRPDGLALGDVVARGAPGRTVVSLLGTGRGHPMLVEATRGTHVVTELTPTGPTPLWDERSRVHIRAITNHGQASVLHVSTPTAHGTVNRHEGSTDPASAVLRHDPAVHLRITATSADGTPVDVLLSIPRRLLDTSGRLQGRAPVLLTAYGGFGHANSASYDAGARAWVLLGGIHATALVRGGGEHGPAWHAEGRGPKGKHRAVDDLVAAVQMLAAGWATGGAVALAGASHGALLAAAASLQVPQQVAAVTLLCPLLDLEHIDDDPMGTFWTDEVGDPKDPHDQALLRALSPVRIASTPGPPAPPTLVVVATDDARVPPHHGSRYADVLVDGPRRPTRGPVLLRSLQEQGHGPRSMDRVDALSTDLLTFAHRWAGQGRQPDHQGDRAGQDQGWSDPLARTPGA